jgi:hypothetical protein
MRGDLHRYANVDYSVNKSGPFENGWVGVTHQAIKEQYGFSVAVCSNGLGFCAADTLRANGIDPKAVPGFFRNYDFIKKIQACGIELTFVEVPQGGAI